MYFQYSALIPNQISVPTWKFEGTLQSKTLRLSILDLYTRLCLFSALHLINSLNIIDKDCFHTYCAFIWTIITISISVVDPFFCYTFTLIFAQKLWWLACQYISSSWNNWMIFNTFLFIFSWAFYEKISGIFWRIFWKIFSRCLHQAYQIHIKTNSPGRFVSGLFCLFILVRIQLL